jgi:hypothetical protein
MTDIAHEDILRFWFEELEPKQWWGKDPALDALIAERGADERVWGSMVKQALKRRKPGFNEGYYGFRSFNALLEEAAVQGLLRLERDEKSGGYLIRPVI